MEDSQQEKSVTVADYLTFFSRSKDKLIGLIILHNKCGNQPNNSDCDFIGHYGEILSVRGEEEGYSYFSIVVRMFSDANGVEHFPRESSYYADQLLVVDPKSLPKFVKLPKLIES